MTRSAIGRCGAWRAAGGAALLLGASSTWAHGEQAPMNPWVEGSAALFGDPASVLVLLVLGLWMAQPGQPPCTTAVRSGAAGLVAGALLAAGGLVLDLTLVLLAATLVIGVLVAWARPMPVALHALLAAAIACGVVLMLAPAATAGAGFRFGWLAGVLLVTALLFANLLGLALALLGRRPGPVRRMLVRVAGSWLGTAALLAGVLELSRRSF